MQANPAEAIDTQLTKSLRRNSFSNRNGDGVMTTPKPIHPATMSHFQQPAVPTKPGRHFTSLVKGLQIHIAPDGHRDWLVRVELAGTPLDVRIGSYPELSPIAACIRAAALRGKLTTEFAQMRGV